MIHDLLAGRLPGPLEPLIDLALDLRFTASRTAVDIWRTLDAETWERTENPYLILMNAHQERLEQLASDAHFLNELRRCISSRVRDATRPCWFGTEPAHAALRGVAYFSMEFGLSEALPIYSGGLGFLAGDHLRSASDLGIPLVAVGLLYQQGYFSQVISAAGEQLEAFPFNDPSSMPILPLRGLDGRWLRVRLPLPNRTLIARTWEVKVGRVRLLLLDTNDPRNTLEDRTITANLYDAGSERRLLQEVLLGIGGWQLLEKLGIETQVCHLNEGHPAFVVLARAAAYARDHQTPFAVALRATRSGNVFTTHTPVEAAFDRFDAGLVQSLLEPMFRPAGLDGDQLLALGRRDPDDASQAFHMAYLAMRGCSRANAVSRLHGHTSRALFAPLFPRRARLEVPIRHITNGVHVGEWDSGSANRLWRAAVGEGQSWRDQLERTADRIQEIRDPDIWKFRAEARMDLVQYVRRRHARRQQERGASEAELRAARQILDPNHLTIGFARRFTAYKRPTLLLHDPDRLARLLRSEERPVQLIVAGKSHPNDRHGKQLVQQMVQFSWREDVAGRIVFLEDYDLVLAQHLAGGVDLWLNQPRRPAEACGTSGMKMLANGGLHCSSLDGWWDEAYAPEVGWALGDRENRGPEADATDAELLYRLLENEIVQSFYTRDADGIPRAWVARVRSSMSHLTPRFSADRMLREYVDQAYLPAAEALRLRAERGPARALDLERWSERLKLGWPSLRFVEVQIKPQAGALSIEARAYLGELDASAIQAEVFSEAPDVLLLPMQHRGPLPGFVNVHVYTAVVPADRPARNYTPRLIPHHPDSLGPIEHSAVLWSK